MSVDHPAPMIDTAVDIRIDGLRPGSTVVVRAQTTGYDGTPWRSETSYRASGGYVDETATPDPATVIPVERIRGPELAVGGGSDALWPSAFYVKAIMDRLDANHFRYPHQNLTYPDAGHGVGVLIPYGPTAGTVDPFAVRRAAAGRQPDRERAGTGGRLAQGARVHRRIR